MSISCETIARHILPVYRSFVAKELVVKFNLTQNDAAKKLGTTQAAVSQYINSKRGVRGVPNYAEIEPIVQEVARKTAASMAKGEMSLEQFSGSFCELCQAIRKNKLCH